MEVTFRAKRLHLQFLPIEMISYVIDLAMVTVSFQRSCNHTALLSRCLLWPNACSVAASTQTSLCLPIDFPFVTSFYPSTFS